MKYKLLKNKQTGERRVLNTKTGQVVSETENPEVYKDLRKKALQAIARSETNSVMESLGLTKVIGSVSGKTYWE